MTSFEWRYKPVRELATALAAREISACELAEAAIARIESLDMKLNAVCARDFDRARAAARAADDALATGERRPLLGIPLLVKESFNVASPIAGRPVTAPPAMPRATAAVPPGAAAGRPAGHRRRVPRGRGTGDLQPRSRRERRSRVSALSPARRPTCAGEGGGPEAPGRPGRAPRSAGRDSDRSEVAPAGTRYARLPPPDSCSSVERGRRWRQRTGN